MSDRDTEDDGGRVGVERNVLDGAHFHPAVEDWRAGFQPSEAAGEQSYSQRLGLD